MQPEALDIIQSEMQTMTFLKEDSKKRLYTGQLKPQTPDEVSDTFLCLACFYFKDCSFVLILHALSYVTAGKKESTTTKKQPLT